MRTRYLVAYDIADPERLRRVARILEGVGTRQQYSVFLADLLDRQREELETKLGEVIHHAEDQVLFVDVGPSEGRGSKVFAALGKPFVPPSRQALVI